MLCWLTVISPWRGRSRSRMTTITTAVLVAVVIVVILDLDRPRQGLITVSQQSMIDLRDSLTPTRP